MLGDAGHFAEVTADTGVFKRIDSFHAGSLSKLCR
jgi:hypothetical protein